MVRTPMRSPTQHQQNGATVILGAHDDLSMGDLRQDARARAVVLLAGADNCWHGPFCGRERASILLTMRMLTQE